MKKKKSKTKSIQIDEKFTIKLKRQTNIRWVALESSNIKKTTMTTTTTTVKSQPRKSYKTELHAMVLRINMYVSKSI